jgi:transcription antitermination factor NusG
MSEQRWYVAGLKPLENWQLVKELLESRGFEAFVPVDKRRLFLQNKLVHIDEPIFPGYILARFDLADEWQSWRQIGRVHGIKSLLPIRSEIPSALPIGFVEELQVIKKIADVVETIRKFERHDLVKLIAGPLAGQIGRVLSSTATSTWVRSTVFGKLKASTGNLVRA